MWLVIIHKFYEWGFIWEQTNKNGKRRMLQVKLKILVLMKYVVRELSGPGDWVLNTFSWGTLSSKMMLKAGQT